MPCAEREHEPLDDENMDQEKVVSVCSVLQSSLLLSQNIL